MGKFTNILAGIKVLETVESPINGKLVVQKDLAWGVHIIGGGLTQSGGVAEKVWRTSLKEVNKKKEDTQKALILGLGGGSIAKLIREIWPASNGKQKAKIDGVEIDPIMVEIGRKYMQLDEWNVDIFLEDAKVFVREALEDKNKYDLICVDMYVQQEVPSEFSTKKFVEKIYELLSDGGIAVFNRLYFDEKRRMAEEFRKLLENKFERVDEVHPEANVMYLATR